MVLLSYSEDRFVDGILTGIKDNTTRPLRTGKRLASFLMNERLHHYYKSRTPNGFKIGESDRNRVRVVHFFNQEVAVLGETYTGDNGFAFRWYGEGTSDLIWYDDPHYLSERQREDYARREGFASFEDMQIWFIRKYGLFYINRWNFINVGWDYSSFVPVGELVPAAEGAMS